MVQGLKRQILNLEELPNRFPVTPEKKTVRHLFYGQPYVYRVIYRVIEKKKLVKILAHPARSQEEIPCCGSEMIAARFG